MNFTVLVTKSNSFQNVGSSIVYVLQYEIILTMPLLVKFKL